MMHPPTEERAGATDSPPVALDRHAVRSCFPGGAGTQADGGNDGSTATRDRVARRLIVALVALGVIGSAIWYLELGGSWPSGGTHTFTKNGFTVGGVQTDGASGTFVSLESEGIKLGTAPGDGPKLGQPAPDFTLLDLNGAPITLSDLRGKTVMINFWATWCTPCRQEFPELVKTYNQYAGQGLVIVGVDLQEDPAAVRSFAEEFSATFPVVIDASGEVGKRYRLVGLPVTWFVDTQGVMRAQQIGPVTATVLAKKLADTGFTAAER